MKTETIHIRLEPTLKTSVEATLRELGMTTAEAVNIFFHQILLHDGLPFSVKKPKYSAETLAALKESDDIANGIIPAKSYNNAAELIREAQESLDAED
ncbi:MAG: type II toxin-antitoxin system RelB/DinJ family antitoxin [Methanobrevibacter sp.]|uniref:Damage-inducible protein n=1 Tax=Anaerovibrio lipolyticus TaxID=82374 RepID=A0A0B2JZ14_9FIRM|nr:type II toxin-antitoxin system RelB/DinJ family antitoxin [Anaerovibrio lipolyticus]KHM52769.1 damage-inducible protein [Anaerovibrio lipolyticus]MBO6275594.1 type II toxin-antitoxin system RelB/DinJ family antitoxin [Methanobrevibacter sp.]